MQENIDCFARAMEDWLAPSSLAASIPILFNRQTGPRTGHVSAHCTGSTGRQIDLQQVENDCLLRYKKRVQENFNVEAPIIGSKRAGTTSSAVHRDRDGDVNQCTSNTMLATRITNALMDGTWRSLLQVK